MRFKIGMSIFALATTLATAAPHPALQGNGAAIPITKRSSLVNSDNTVNVDVLSSHVASVSAKILRSFDYYEKNTGISHPSAAKRSGTENDVSVGLTNYKKELWYGTITIGNPPKPFTVEFDTGSADFFVPSSTCDATCIGHTRWDHARDLIAHKLGRPFTARFGDGNVVTGNLYSANVTIAGFTATTQTIGAAQHYSSGFQKAEFPPDGMMGMAFHTLSRSKENTVFETLVSEGKVTDPVFSLKINSTGGELHIGGSNRALYTGDFTYTKVTQQAHWQVNLQNVQVRGKVIMRNIPAIIDSGAAVIGGRPSQILALHKALGGQRAPSSAGEGIYTFPCKKVPKVSLTFGGRSFPVVGLSLGQLSPGSPDCISAITDLPNPRESFWVIGGAFLQGVYTRFDVENLQVGFAKLI